MLILYEFLLIIYVVVHIPILLLKGKMHGGFLQRMGFFSKTDQQKLEHQKNIWIHAVSVGEVIAVSQLIRQLKLKHPGYQIVLTVSTQTGYELAVKKLLDKVIVLWSPLDFRWTVSLFVRVIAPKVYVVTETEIWPNLLTLLHTQRIPIVLINGRISDRSYGAYLKIRWFMKRFLGYVNVLCMQSDLDVKRILAIGAPQDRVRNIGNVKFDDLPEDTVFHLGDFGFGSNDRLWIAGSTHPGEEEIVLGIFDKIRTKYPLLRLVIAPRHVERAMDVQTIIEGRGLRSVRLSEMKSGIHNPNSIVIVDTIGHLRALYSLATLVFVGKSLTVQGGHNIIEPAYFSKPIIVGPHMQNFRDVMMTFRSENALIEVQDAQELQSAVENLLNDPKELANFGKRARQVISRQQGATQRGVEIISRFLEEVL